MPSVSLTSPKVMSREPGGLLGAYPFWSKGVDARMPNAVSKNAALAATSGTFSATSSIGSRLAATRARTA